jgi:hypothetical protein
LERRRRWLPAGFQIGQAFASANAFNHTQLGVPVRNVADTNFGRILSARAARINQLGAKIVF